MKDSILKKLSETTEEEQIFLNSGDTVKKAVYSRSSRFYVEKAQMCRSNICYGSESSPINMKTHIRLTDFPPHSHDYIEIMYVCQGEITNIIDNEEIKLLTGDIIILGKDTIHSTKKTSMNDVGIVLLISYDFFISTCNKLRESTHISDEIFAKITATDTSTYCLFHTNGIPEIENLTENIISSFIYKKEKSASVLQMEFQLLISYLEELPHDYSKLHESNSKTDKALREFNNYIETSYTTATLPRAAKLLGFSPTYACRWVNRHYGMTFQEILREKRFSVAFKLLSDSALSINEIARAIGYENTSYFYKEFNKRFGVTPKTVRNNNK